MALALNQLPSTDLPSALIKCKMTGCDSESCSQPTCLQEDPLDPAAEAQRASPYRDTIQYTSAYYLSSSSKHG
jgi:hypothetical protein